MCVYSTIVTFYSCWLHDPMASDRGHHGTNLLRNRGGHWGTEFGKSNGMVSDAKCMGGEWTGGDKGQTDHEGHEARNRSWNQRRHFNGQTHSPLLVIPGTPQSEKKIITQISSKVGVVTGTG